MGSAVVEEPPGEGADQGLNVAPAGVFAELARALAETGGMGATLQEIVHYATAVVPCDWAAVVATDRVGPKPDRRTTSNDAELLATVADIAAAAGASPATTAFRDGSMVYSPDLSVETRFAGYAASMVERTPIRSVLSFGLQLRHERLGVLSVYSRRPHAFGDDAVERASVIADHAAIAIESQAASARAGDLESALQSNRVIGMALGILMGRHEMTADEAFQVLRRASSYSNRKLALIAEELVETGHLPQH